MENAWKEVNPSCHDSTKVGLQPGLGVEVGVRESPLEGLIPRLGLEAQAAVSHYKVYERHGTRERQPGLL